MTTPFSPLSTTGWASMAHGHRSALTGRAQMKILAAMSGREWGEPISRRRFFDVVWKTGLAGSALLAPSLLEYPALAVVSAPRKDRPSITVTWNQAFLQGVRESKLGPPMVARALAMCHTSVYDAWAAYDRLAVGTRLGGSLRRPPRERNLPNKSKAISFAGYRAGVDLFPASRASVFDPLMAQLGYDPSDMSTDVTTPSGIGNVASAALLDYRHHDGSNQLGDEPG